MHFFVKKKHQGIQGDYILFLNNFNFEVICKYFYGESSKAYGDWQSLKPLSIPLKSTEDYTVTSSNGFININFKDGFVLSRLFDYAVKNFSDAFLQKTEPCDYDFQKAVSNGYLKYLFSIYIKDFWKMQSSEDVSNLHFEGLDLEPYRELSIMALYLIEKGPLNCEPSLSQKNFNKLYNIFADRLNEALREKSVLNAPDILKMLTVCAINIRAYQEA